MDRNEPLLLKVSEAARLLGVSKSTAYVMAAKREIPVVRIRGGLRVPAESLRVWITQKLDGPGIAATIESESREAAAKARK